ncbi:hypothetical protein BESB_068810 [Besnoitia besnoiti]|uniref:Thioesterase domain-containing protein n=1 Tax=Besnoitia besnoiti TaxID=94643 RepID=A0A2A9M8P3_BESBE|nr:hypothetical protein BESB_068810 [Besnoitia besnoiti]PFH34848.1 hypothetical protein BESB_068810 [Besnoitia besnoiti]
MGRDTGGPEGQGAGGEAAGAPSEPASESCVHVDGERRLCDFAAVPQWCRFFFTRPAYHTLRVGGVLDPAYIESGSMLLGSNAAADAKASTGEGASALDGEEISCAREEEEDDYCHLLHDILTAYGNVSDLHYFMADSPADAAAPEQAPEESPSLSQLQMLVFCRVGRKVCGHKGVVHGGFLATLLDNALGYTAHFVFKRAATKTLEIKYVRPLLADSAVLADVTVESVDSAAGVCAVVGTVYARIPGSLRHLQSTAASSAARDEKKRQAKRPPTPPDVWVVAVGRATMVDVTQKWKGIQ